MYTGSGDGVELQPLRLGPESSDASAARLAAWCVVNSVLLSAAADHAKHVFDNVFHRQRNAHFLEPRLQKRFWVALGVAVVVAAGNHPTLLDSLALRPGSHRNCTRALTSVLSCFQGWCLQPQAPSSGMHRAAHLTRQQAAACRAVSPAALSPARPLTWRPPAGASLTRRQLDPSSSWPHP